MLLLALAALLATVVALVPVTIDSADYLVN